MIFGPQLQLIHAAAHYTGRRIRSAPGLSLVSAGLVLALLVTFWPSLADMGHHWTHDARYSHGYLVPLFSLYLLWARRDRLDTAASRPSAWGLPCLLAGLALRFAGTYLYLDWLDGIALLPCLAALCLLLGGRTALSWTWPAIAFLAFMVPLPFRVETALAHPLQGIACRVSTYALQTLGFTAYSEGNVIRMGDVRLGVVEACSGLSMLLIFVALCTAVSMLVPRWLDKTVLLLSAVPLALIANITRITVTGVLHKTVGSRLADLVFHDLAGWLMMVLALVLLWIEFRLLHWVLVPVAAEESQPLGPAAPERIDRPEPRRSSGRSSALPAILSPLKQTLGRKS